MKSDVRPVEAREDDGQEMRMDIAARTTWAGPWEDGLQADRVRTEALLWLRELSHDL